MKNNKRTAIFVIILLLIISFGLNVYLMVRMIGLQQQVNKLYSSWNVEQVRELYI